MFGFTLNKQGAIWEALGCKQHEPNFNWPKQNWEIAGFSECMGGADLRFNTILFLFLSLSLSPQVHALVKQDPYLQLPMERAM